MDILLVRECQGYIDDALAHVHHRFPKKYKELRTEMPIIKGLGDTILVKRAIAKDEKKLPHDEFLDKKYRQITKTILIPNLKVGVFITWFLNLQFALKCRARKNSREFFVQIIASQLFCIHHPNYNLAEARL